MIKIAYQYVMAHDHRRHCGRRRNHKKALIDSPVEICVSRENIPMNSCSRGSIVIPSVCLSLLDSHEPQWSLVLGLWRRLAGWLVTLSIRFFIKCISAMPASTHKTGISWSQMLSHLFLLLETSFPLSIFDIHGSCNTQTHTRSLFIHSRTVLVANFSDYFFNRGSQKRVENTFLPTQQLTATPHTLL